MQMQKRKFRIGDLAQKLNLDKFVIRFWEKEFELNSDRSNGGQRFYEEKDFEAFQQIKTLLYEQKFTIAGAKKQLRNLNLNQNTNNSIIASQKTNTQNTYNYNENSSIPGSKSHTLNTQKTLITQIAFGSQDDKDAPYAQNKNQKFSYTGAQNKQNTKLNPKILKKMVDLKQNLIKLKELLD